MNARKIFDYFKETYQEWQSDDAFQKSASIAYYSVFSLPGLLIHHRRHGGQPDLES